MNTQTRDFLLECKNAGYTMISIGVKDKRVPSSMKIEWYGEQKYHKEDGGYVPPSNGWYTGGVVRESLEGEQIGWSVRPHVVCGEPPVAYAEPHIFQGARPAIWGICENSTLTAGMEFGGFGCGETHMIRNGHNLNLGVYDITGEVPQLIKKAAFE